MRSPNASIFSYHANSHEINCVPQQFGTIHFLTYGVCKEIAWNVDSVGDIFPYSVGAISVNIGFFRVGKARKSLHEHWMKIHYYKETNTSSISYVAWLQYSQPTKSRFSRMCFVPRTRRKKSLETSLKYRLKPVR